MLPHSQIILDTPGIEFYNPKKNSYPEKIYVQDSQGKTTTITLGIEYEGYIVSLFHGNQLIFQSTNSSRLRDKGLNNLTDELVKNHAVN